MDYQIKAHQTNTKRVAMKIEKIHKNLKSDNLEAIQLYELGFSVAEIANIQNRTPSSISSAILRARRRSPNSAKLHKKYNFLSEKTKLNIKTGSIVPAIMADLCPDVQKWIITKTLEGGYDSIAFFFTDLVGEAYFADQ